jgi:hypothetical protein
MWYLLLVCGGRPARRRHRVLLLREAVTVRRGHRERVGVRGMGAGGSSERCPMSKLAGEGAEGRRHLGLVSSSPSRVTWYAF